MRYQIAIVAITCTWNYANAEEGHSVPQLHSILNVLSSQIRDELSAGGDFAAAAAQEFGVDREETRAILSALIEDMDNHRKSKSKSWSDLTESGGYQAKPKQVDKALKELLKKTQKQLKKSTGKIYVQSMIAEAAKKAKFQPHHLRALLLNAIGAQLIKTVEFPAAPSFELHGTDRGLLAQYDFPTVSTFDSFSAPGFVAIMQPNFTTEKQLIPLVETQLILALNSRLRGDDKIGACEWIHPPLFKIKWEGLPVELAQAVGRNSATGEFAADFKLSITV